jgi:hypothetical protein
VSSTVFFSFFPGAAQREPVRCRTEAVTISIPVKVPDQQRTTPFHCVLRCIRDKHQ